MAYYNWIPAHAGNRTVLAVYELLCLAQKLKDALPWRRGAVRRQCAERLESNRRELCHVHLSDRGYLEYQSRCSRLLFGRTNVAYSGCEVIALYNLQLYWRLRDASSPCGSHCLKPDFRSDGRHISDPCALRSTGPDIHGRQLCWVDPRGLRSMEPDSLPELLAWIEKDGMVRDGVWGTSPLALVRVLKEQGFRVGTAVGEPAASALLKNYDSLLLTLYNNGNDIRDQIHTVCVTAEGAGEAFCIHNAAGCGPVYAEGVRTMQELTAAIPGGRAKLILAVGAGLASCAADSR